ncbi:C-type lectin domain family 2 member D-like [Mya arenaria]|uniref:C-type lectin domain family 2 member D-like n=1 Tax=Mya arenaria TaxID=6604 RepID=UPI0022E070C5|nr:C-type lectin domain family 2 member D-like [Mya arenaria]
MYCGYDERCKSVFYGEDDGTCTLCSEVFNYYAHRPAVANVHTKHLRPLQGSCPEGWMGFQYSCYTLTNASNGFHHDECVTMGAHAVYVESIEEQNFLTNTLSPATGGDELYLGYKKINNILY